MAIDRTTKYAGFSLIIRSGTVSEKIKTAVVEGLVDIGEKYLVKVKTTIGLEDHTLAELRKLGHPYRVGAAPNSIHGDDRMVHVQSGKLRDTIRVQPVEETTSRKFSVYVSSTAPEMAFLIYGTSKMRPRRFHEKAYESIKSVYWNPVLDRVGKINYRIATSSR